MYSLESRTILLSAAIAVTMFFSDDDRHAYLNWLKEYSQEHKVDVLAYCLMTNHIHLVFVPNTEEGLNRMLKPLHIRYAQRVNREKGRKGHLWQGRYFSSHLRIDRVAKLSH